jgi:hypothetical protein
MPMWLCVAVNNEQAKNTLDRKVKTIPKHEGMAMGWDG